MNSYLLHSPFPAKSRAELVAAWREMEACQQEGLAESIGVSNFSIDYLKMILEDANVKPAVNQIEMHPYLNQADLYAFLKAQGIAFVGFASLSPMRLEPTGRTMGVCKQLGEDKGVSASSVLFRWVLEQGASAVVTTSSSRERLATALKEVDSFRLNKEEVEQISHSALGKYVRSFFADDFASGTHI